VGEVLVARVHRLEPAAIDGDDGRGEKIELTTQHDELPTGRLYRRSNILGKSAIVLKSGAKRPVRDLLC
jgi:hypothetical protein